MKTTLRKTLGLLLLLSTVCILYISPTALAEEDRPYKEAILDNLSKIQSVGHQDSNGEACSCYALAYCRTLLDNSVHKWYEYNSDGYGQNENHVWCDWSKGNYYPHGDDRADADVFQTIYSEICDGYPVIIRVSPNESHFVAVVGVTNVPPSGSLNENNFLIIDPSPGTEGPYNMASKYTLYRNQEDNRAYFIRAKREKTQPIGLSVAIPFLHPYITGNCTPYPTNLSIRTTKSTNLKSLPCSWDTNHDSATLESSLPIGTTFTTTKLYVNHVNNQPDNNVWYEVSIGTGEGAKTGYVYSGDTEVISRSNTVSRSGGNPIPEIIDYGHGYWVTWLLTSEYLLIDTVQGFIYDSEGNVLSDYCRNSIKSGINEMTYQLGSEGRDEPVDGGLPFPALPEGVYTCRIIAKCRSYYGESDGSLDWEPVWSEPVAFTFIKEGSRSAYLDACTQYPTDLSIQVASSSAYLKSLPCNPGTNADSVNVFSSPMPIGENLRVTRLYVNDQGECWYYTSYNGKPGYVYSGKTEALIFGDETVRASGGNPIPTTIAEDRGYWATWLLSSVQLPIDTVQGEILDGNGNVVSQYCDGSIKTGINAMSYQLGSQGSEEPVDGNLDFLGLPAGYYRCKIKAKTLCYYGASDGSLQTRECWVEPISFDFVKEGEFKGAGQTIPDGNYLIACSVNPNYYLDIEGTNVPAASNTNVILSGPLTDDPLAADIWTVTYIDDGGFYTIHQMGTDISLDVDGANSTNGTNIKVWTAHDSDAQKWSIARFPDGGYSIQAKCSGLCVDITNGTISAGINIDQWTPNGSGAQEWTFIPFEYVPPAQNNKIIFHPEGGSLGEPIASRNIDGINTGRSNGQLIVYNDPSQRVECNAYGMEIGVDSAGEIVSIRAYGDETQLPIPNNGFVLSGHLAWPEDPNDGCNFLDDFSIGQYAGVDYDNSQVYVYGSFSDYLANNKYVKSNEQYGTLPEPNRENYVFAGWYTSAEGGTKITSSTAYSTNELYAHWSTGEYTVNIDNGITHGQIAADLASAVAGGTVTLTVTPDSGYLLADKSLSVTYIEDEQAKTASTTHDPHDPTKYIFTMPTGDVTVSALFTRRSIAYVDENNVPQEPVDGYTVIAADTTTMNSGWYVVTSNVTNNNRLSVSGNVYIILCDNTTLTLAKGITVAGNNSLTIYGQTNGTGTLTINNADENSAGIGGSVTESCGTITICGGTINTSGKYRGAGIGGGGGKYSNSSYNASGGIISIKGGSITATGGSNSIDGGGAGIGGGYRGSGGTIVITGGNITSTGGIGSAGIGGGDEASGGSIIISGGSLIANGTGEAAGVGGGYEGSGGAISITGGNITAYGNGNASGIGGGNSGSGGTISILGGAVTATSGNSGTGIGAGTYGEGANITLGWTSADDYIQAKNYSGTVAISTGKRLMDETDNRKSFAGSDLNVSDLTNTKLIPDERTFFSVSTTSPENGSLTANREEAIAEEIITLTVTSANGYVLEENGLSVTYIDGGQTKSVTIMQDTNDPTKYTFTMPEANVTVSATFRPLQYTIAYDANGGTNAPNSLAKIHDTALTLATSTPTRANASAGSYTVTLNANGGNVSTSSLTAERTTRYSFTTWNTAEDGTGTSYAPGESYVFNEPLTLYAQWTGITTTEAVTLPTPTREGHSFLGWGTSSSAESGITGSYTPSTDVTLYALWTSDTYSIVFDANGGEIAPETHLKTYGTDLTLPNVVPTRSDASAGSYTVTLNANDGSTDTNSLSAERTTSYVFQNWNTSRDGSGTNYAPSASYTANASATLYAQWSSSTMTAAVTLPTPTREGYSFHGWGTGPNSTSGVTGEFVPSENVIFYAVWVANTYPVTYNANGGSDVPEGQVKAHDVGLSLSNFKPTHESSSAGSFTVTLNANGGNVNPASLSAAQIMNYSFTGWNTKADGSGDSYSSGASYATNEPLTLYAQWESSTAVEAVSLPIPTQDGYSFLGWGTSSNAASGIVGNYTPSADVTLYALWDADDYAINYDANGGEGAPVAQAKKHDIALTLSNTTPTRADSNEGSYTVTLNANGSNEGLSSLVAERTTRYSFTAWNSSADGNGASYAPNASYTLNESATLYAQWESNTTTASVVLPELSRDGYSFLGWSEDATAANGITGQYTPTGDITLYALWKAHTYSIAYYANGGAGIPDTQTKTHDIDLPLSDVTPTKVDSSAGSYIVALNANGGNVTSDMLTAERTTSYSFTGWNTKIGGNGTSYASGASYTANENITLYAQWESSTATAPVSLPVPTREGYSFLGWGTSSSAESGITGEYTPSGNVMLYALWKANTYAVTFDTNGGEGEPGAQEKTHGINLILNTAEPTHDSIPAGSTVVALNANGGTVSTDMLILERTTKYSFRNWNTQPDGSGTNYAPGATYTANEAITLYAQWDTSVETASVTLPTPTRDGYSFQGWGTSSNAESGVTGEYTPSGNVMLYAIWEANKYTITFVDDDGTVLQTGEVAYGTMPTYTGVTPSKEASAQYTYTFEDWSPAVSDVTGNAIYTAIYSSTVNKYNVTFIDEDGTVLKSATQYDYGTAAGSIVKPANPTKAATAQYTYDFAGWSPAIAEVTEDATYTATYSSTVNQYSVTFVDEDGTLLKAATEYDYGTTAANIVKPADPTKEATAQYSYAFAGWSPAIAEVTKDTTYTATYSSTVRKYTIKFINDNGTVLQTGEIAYGTTPTYTGQTPAKAATAQYTYTFMGWDKTLVPVTGDATYTATFTATPVFGTPTFKLPAAIKTIGESAFEGLPMTIVEIPSGCESIGKWAFKDCSSLTQIRIPASVTFIDDKAFDGCANVFIYGAANSTAKTFCDNHANCTFVAENTST